MRLRLTVQRNGLPAANILWSIPETNSTQAYTITRLLEDVNLIIPLEAEHWGLEHYVAEVGGFECLHFMPVANALKEDDHVSIRPLMTAEVRARTLTGREQISDGGQHLVDGIPFGRPYLRQPNRPAVRIPPRKRRRLDDGEAEDETGVAGLLTQSSSSVQFKQPEVDASDESDEDDEDFAPQGDKDDEDATEEDSDDSDDSDDPDAASGASSSASDTSDSDSASSSDSDSDDESDASAPPDVLSSRDASAKTSKHVPPGHGLSATKSRNARRTRANRLRHLKESGELPKAATLSDLHTYEEAKIGLSLEAPGPAQPLHKPSGKRKHLDEDESIEAVADDTIELEQRKQELMARFGETSSTTASADEPAQPQSLVAEPVNTSPHVSPTLELLAKKETPSRRMRPDTSAISRILARQARPAIKKAKVKAAVEQPLEPEGVSDPDFWKSRINLSAFECWEEDFELSTPPFPFEQHWDPASKLMRDKSSKKRQKRGSNRDAQRESLPAEEDEEEKIILDYDDAPAVEGPDSEITAAIEDQLRQDVATAAQADLPPLPEDTSTLPDLASSDMKVGAVIACRFFTVNPITVTPEISSYKTATVEQEGDSGPGAGTIQLRIALHDLPKKEKKFDSKGNRIYNAADALLMEDEEGEEGLWEGQFGELLEPKLLKAA
ncbi:hypothetical protein EJ02DRAFT_453199 [Clathrospora elynae]|uniref:DUF7357 domain-containing protein n=1 Tax=Clathrospora elynae TaxID=706981 RepID=A0A6A5SUD0_9PLEO|nr:hypothetical protein EJ02DRAFT_453199 [Clathrospora elynae]